jgi:hypothetical protein
MADSETRAQRQARDKSNAKKSARNCLGRALRWSKCDGVLNDLHRRKWQCAQPFLPFQIMAHLPSF